MQGKGEMLWAIVIPIEEKEPKTWLGSILHLQWMNDCFLSPEILLFT